MQGTAAAIGGSCRQPQVAKEERTEDAKSELGEESVNKRICKDVHKASVRNA